MTQERRANDPFAEADPIDVAKFEFAKDVEYFLSKGLTKDQLREVFVEALSA